jgi:hypothetical protein
MAFKDNKRKYANGVEEDAEESTVSPKKQWTNGNDDDGDTSTNDFSSELQVSSEEEEMNLSADSKEKFLIWRAHSDDGDTSDSENNGSIRNGGDTSDDEEEQSSDNRSVFD